MAVPSSVIFYQENTQYIQVDGLQDGLALVNGGVATYFNAATVTATLYDSTGTAVPEVTNLTLVYVPSSNGSYRAVVAATFNPAQGSTYQLKLTAVQGSVQLKLTIRTIVEVRTK